MHYTEPPVIHKSKYQQSMAVHTCHPSTWRGRQKGSEAQYHPQLHAEIESTIGNAEHIEENLYIMRYPRTHFLLNATN